MAEPMLPQDKANHVVAGAMAGVAGSWLAVALGHPEHARAGSLAAAAVAGVAKECLDYLLNRRAIARGLAPPHDVDVMDILATLCGGLLVSARA